jgi:soluble P-type ATPase
MRAAKIDANQPEIVSALRKVGARVQSLAAVGQGVPDLLVSFRGDLYLLEVKDGSKPPSKQALTMEQIVWHRDWAGADLHVVNSVDSALRAIGASHE